MNAHTRQFLTGCLALTVSLLAWAPAAFAQNSQPVQGAEYTSAPVSAQVFAQQELDQMLAPVALYPDSLLTQILMASTYPLEVVQAARWSRANPGFQGDQAVRAVEQQNWDPSVKSLVAFPKILELMDANLDWTERLGNAFLSQESQVWETVQNFRQRADTAGNLQSNDQLLVQRDGPTYVIESPRPDIVYVPYYDPLVVYGDWWWPGYAPMRWDPWLGYYARPGFGLGYYWGGGSGVYVGFGFFFGGIDWHQRHVNVINHNSFYYRNVNRRPAPGNTWQHDPDHRRGVPYRNPALRQQFNRPQPAPATPTSPDTRREFRGYTSGSGPRIEQGDRGQPRPNVSGQEGRGTTQGAQGAGSSPTGPRPPVASSERTATKYPAAQSSVGRPYLDQRPQALEGVGHGQDARNASARGQASFPRPPVVVQPRQPATSSPQPAPQPQRAAPAPVQRTAPAPAQQHAPQQQTTHPGNAPQPRGQQQK